MTKCYKVFKKVGDKLLSSFVCKDVGLGTIPYEYKKGEYTHRKKSDGPITAFDDLLAAIKYGIQRPVYTCRYELWLCNCEKTLEDIDHPWQTDDRVTFGLIGIPKNTIYLESISPNSLIMDSSELNKLGRFNYEYSF